MLRHEWELISTAEDLLAGVGRKIEHHKTRLAVWEEKKEKTLDEIKARGLQIDEGPLGPNSPGTASNDPYRGPRVTIDNTLANHMAAISGKINSHRRKLSSYQAWRDILKTQGKASFKLHHEDWIFFHGELPEEDKE